MTTEEMREKTREELKKAERDARTRMDQMVLDRRQGKVKNVKAYGDLRRELARILTVTKQKP